MLLPCIDIRTFPLLESVIQFFRGPLRAHLSVFPVLFLSFSFIFESFWGVILFLFCSFFRQWSPFISIFLSFFNFSLFFLLPRYLREDLRSYVHKINNATAETGLPMVRPMFMAFEEDPVCQTAAVEGQ